MEQTTKQRRNLCNKGLKNIQIVSCGFKLCYVSTTGCFAGSDYLLQARISIDCFVFYFPSLTMMASFKFNADYVSSLILQQLNFENTSC